MDTARIHRGAILDKARMHRGAILAVQGSLSRGAILGLDNIGWSDVMCLFSEHLQQNTLPQKLRSLRLTPTKREILPIDFH